MDLNGSSNEKRPQNSRTASWDVFGGDRTEWENFKTKDASVEALRFAEGDAGTTRISRFYYWLLNRGIVVRWALYIIPILILLWIPGILGVTAEKDARIWGVKLIWWSIWLTVLWCGWWASTAVFMCLPHVWRQVVGSIIPSAKQYDKVVAALGKYAKLIVWTVVIWITFSSLVNNHSNAASDSESKSNLKTFTSILFGLFICSIVLAAEKLIIQLIA